MRRHVIRSVRVLQRNEYDSDEMNCKSNRLYLKARNEVWPVEKNLVETNDYAVIDKIRSRASNDGKKSSKDKIGLVVQGGAMRGIISGSALIALQALGFTNAFDAVYGSSAGSINAAYFLSNQAAFGGTIYYDDLSTRKFINLFKFPRIMNLDFLTRQIMQTDKRLWAEKVIASRVPLYIGTTEVDTASSVMFSTTDINSPVELFEVLHAGAASPIIYDVPSKLRGKFYVDGGITNRIPLQEAIADGCNHVLVLLTVNEEFRASPFKYPGFVRFLARKWPSVMIDALLQQYIPYNESLDMCFKRVRVPKGVSVYVICPGNSDFILSGNATNPYEIGRAAIEGMARTLDAFGNGFEFITEYLNFLG